MIEKDPRLDKVKKTPPSEEAAEKDLGDLQQEELSGSSHEDPSLSYSDTDEDENEGLGDGKMGKSNADILKK